MWTAMKNGWPRRKTVKQVDEEERESIDRQQNHVRYVIECDIGKNKTDAVSYEPFKNKPQTSLVN